MSLTIGVDVGGTKVAAGVVDEDGRILTRQRRETSARSVEAVVETVGAVVEELRGTYDIDAVGLGIAGFVDASRSRVLVAPNLVGWDDEPLRERVESRIGLPVVVENDANAAAWGEVVFGGGHREQYVVCVTVGTGIGGGVVLAGELYRGRFGVAAEIGHLKLVPGGRPCGCGQRGCWEQYASGNALVRLARKRAAEDRRGAAALLELGDGTPEGVEGKHVTEAARSDDPFAREVFAELGRRLGEGLADLAAILDPGVFVLGGGVSDAGDVLLEPTRTAFTELLTGTGRRPIAELHIAELGNDAGLVGVADLARRR
jgi:glucokinase